MESSVSLKSVTPPRIRSLVSRWKLAFDAVDRRSSSADAMDLRDSAGQYMTFKRFIPKKDVKIKIIYS